MSAPPPPPESVASEDSCYGGGETGGAGAGRAGERGVLDAYFASSTPGIGVAGARGRGGGNAEVTGGARSTFAFAEILETARSSTLDDLGSLLETIAEARQQQDQQKEQQAAAAATTVTTAEEAEARQRQRQKRKPPAFPPPRPRFVAVHPACASHVVTASAKKKKKVTAAFSSPLFSAPQLQLLLQGSAAVGISSCFVLVDAIAFRQACLAVGFALIIMLIGSSSSSVGSRLISCASFVLPLLLGAVGGGVAASLAGEVSGAVVVPSSSSSSPTVSYYARAREPQFTIALVGFNLFVLALASAWR